MKDLFKTLSLALLVSTIPLCAWAQFSGNIQGDVEDASHAAISNAAVTLTNLATNVVETTKADSTGGYHFTSLAPGDYNVAASASGFATATVAITLLTGQTLNVPIQMKVGSTSESVTVTAEAPVLNTADSRTQLTIETQELTNLPLQGRNLLALATVAPGVTGLGLAPGGSPGSAADNFSTETQVDASANGRGSVGNMFVVDGMDVTSDIRPGVLNLTPNPDAIQETSIQTNTFSTEFGRASSLQMVMTTKSGSREFHGSASDYFTYQNLWALTEFASPRKYSPFHSNNISGSIGGPILPKHQFFFFFSVEPLRASSSTAASSQTFEDSQFTAWAQQNFPNTVGTSILANYTPSAATVTGVAKFASDVFPTTCGTAATSNLPCDLPLIDNGVFNSSSYRNGTQWNTRIDKYFSKDRIYGNIFRTTLGQGGPAIRPAFASTNHYVTDSLQVNETHTVSTTMLNEAAFGYNKVEGILNQTGDFTVPSVSVTGQGVGFGIGFAQGDFIQHNYHWRDVLTKVKGSHSLKFGYEGRHGDDLALFAPVYNQPNFSFDNLLALVQDQPHSESGLAYDVLSGQPAKGQYEYAVTIHGVFFEDTWKVRNNLTLTYGLRWDDFGNPYPLSGTTLANFHLGQGSTIDEQIANGVMRKQSNVFNQSLAKVFSPRVGFSWDPTGSGDWVVRGGFGVYHDWPTLGNDENGLKGNPPGWVVPTFLSTGGTAAPIFALGTSKSTPAGFPYPQLPGSQLDSHGGLVGSQISVGGIDPGLTPPISYIYTATVERKLVKDMVASIGYSGSRSTNLITGGGQETATSYGVDINRFSGDLIVNNGTLTRLNPSFGGITYAQNGAEGHYNALIVATRGRFARRGYFNASYTRSQSKDDSQIYPTFTNLSQYISPSVWDAPNRFSLSLSYDLPGMASGKGLLGRLTNGWSVSDITILQSGTPFVVYTNASFQGGGDYNADGFNYDFPDVGSYSQHTGRQDYLNGIFTSAQFSAPAAGMEGNEQPYRFREPGYANTDISLLKNTKIWERLNFQLRFDFFNAFNRPNLFAVDANLPDGSFGKATNQYNPRWIQLGASITF
ncbi:MAG TPA: carboxypeptidase regulatory-like domain-containing protein [Terriglobales bacterium]|nr:carboxypeptidase regulatory-like domain-containing protein [Terriglobales bacterium]